MPEEIINNEIVKEVVEKTVENVVATPKKIRGGKFILGTILVTGAVALGTWVYTKVAKKPESAKDATVVDGAVVDNVKIAERDCLDKDESEE